MGSRGASVTPELLVSIDSFSLSFTQGRDTGAELFTQFMRIILFHVHKLLWHINYSEIIKADVLDLKQTSSMEAKLHFSSSRHITN